jgi:hypothetical protein
MSEDENILLFRVAQKSFEEATATSLGATFHVIISFHLKKKFGKDPYEVLIEDPHLFYEGLKEVLDEGAKSVIALAGTYLVAKYKINCTVDEFTDIFTETGPAAHQKLSALFRTVIAQEEQKLK